jgi:hypothetical protein
MFSSISSITLPRKADHVLPQLGGPSVITEFQITKPMLCQQFRKSFHAEELDVTANIIYTKVRIHFARHA